GNRTLHCDRCSQAMGKVTCYWSRTAAKWPLTRVSAGRPGGEGHDLVGETPALKRGSRAVLAFEVVFVLRHTADLVSVGHQLRRLEHGHVDLGLHRLQLVVDRVEAIDMIVLHQADRSVAGLSVALTVEVEPRLPAPATAIGNGGGGLALTVGEPDT